MTTKDVAGGGSLRASEREDSDAGGNPGTSLPPINAEPSCVGLVRKALFVLNMNFYKDRVRYEIKMRHLRELRDACQGFVEWYDRGQR